MVNEDLRVLVIAGGLGHERDVSIRSGIRVQNCLKRQGFIVDVVDFDKELLAAVDDFSPQVVFPLVHGSMGEDGSLASLLELAGLPFVGSASGPARVASDKPSFKSVLRQNGLLTPNWFTLPQSLFRQQGADRILSLVDQRLTYPLAVKPALGGSALGVSVVRDGGQLRSALIDAFAYHDTLLLEDYIAGVEVAGSVVSDLNPGDLAVDNLITTYLRANGLADLAAGSPGLEPADDAVTSPLENETGANLALPLPLVEVTHDGLYDYDARYNPGRIEYFTPARLDAPASIRVMQSALSVHKLLGLRHLSRTDMILDADGQVWVIDTNSVPGMTDTSLFPLAANALCQDPEVQYLLNSLPLTVPAADKWGFVLGQLVRAACPPNSL